MDNNFLPEIDTSLCDGCGLCLPACRSQALALVGGVAALARPDLCQWDGECELACPLGAIKVGYLIVFEANQPLN